MVERGIADDQLVLEGSERRRWLDADLLPKMGAEPLVGAQRLGVPVRSVECHHQVGGEPFPERMLANQALELADKRRRQPSTQVRIDAQLHRLQAQLLEARDLSLGERLVDQIFVRAAPPQGQPFAGHERSRRRIGLEQTPGLPQQRLEPPRIDVVRFDVEHVARGPGEQPAALGPLGAIRFE